MLEFLVAHPLIFSMSVLFLLIAIYCLYKAVMFLISKDKSHDGTTEFGENHMIPLSDYISKGYKLKVGDLIGDRLALIYDISHGVPCKVSVIMTQRQLNYFNSNPSFVDEYVVVLNTRQFIDYLNNKSFAK